MVLKQRNSFFLYKCSALGLRIRIWVNANRFDPLSHKYSWRPRTLWLYLVAWKPNTCTYKSLLLETYIIAPTALYSLLAN